MKHFKNVIVVLKIIFSCVVFTVFACAPQSEKISFYSQIQQPGQVELAGWARLQGEIMLYSSRFDLEEENRYPACISGVFENHNPENLSIFDNQYVTLFGEVIKYSSLSYENRPVLPRRVLLNNVIPNFCFGEYVLLIYEIELN